MHTIMYEIIKFKKGVSDRDGISSGESDKFTKARKASWAILYTRFG